MGDPMPRDPDFRALVERFKALLEEHNLVLTILNKNPAQFALEADLQRIEQELFNVTAEMEDHPAKAEWKDDIEDGRPQRQILESKLSAYKEARQKLADKGAVQAVELADAFIEEIEQELKQLPDDDLN